MGCEQTKHFADVIEVPSADNADASDSYPHGDVHPCEFECFPAEVQVRDMPIIVFSSRVGEQRIWRRGSVVRGQVRCPRGAPHVRALEPVVMSPAYLGFTVEPSRARYLHYGGVGMLFARPEGGQFMQPSIDTVLLCNGLEMLIAEQHAFHRLIEIGSGSAFVAKFAAMHVAGDGDLDVTAVDIDPTAVQYASSTWFNAPRVGRQGRQIQWTLIVEDAVALLGRESNYDLLISNPPYVPTRHEVLGGSAVSAAKPGADSFWEGTGLLVFLLQLFAEGRCPQHAHLVVIITSLTLKSPRVCETLESLRSRGIRCRCLLEREVAWKAFYAGPAAFDYLLASTQETRSRQRIGENSFYVGATNPGKSRCQTIRDGRQSRRELHWHVAYVLQFSRDAVKGDGRTSLRL